ncbi:succinylglutamate desuccinylase/aspartoacylase family protein [Granulosicoccus antarcticus]|uniref:N-alpha-acetyl-L-2,4-diaminobutyric acid deacetylase n=1 Tax=Granulosicoccus antarcticus IMCC3135 TaxID=1192854 RepID=A0A2Z2NL13_9GAMM|nr:succinylglutamate desuccinylase/aspartoacylase family protein [Granulosicoccus antarcticus]ASJ71215.1 N-alpha-acetyl-L-2,4-diaminobutyric acid deacetylase [Granulosicoccus antarcticus IMCC3135]
MRKPFTLAGTEVTSGTRQMINVPMPNLSAQTNTSMTVHVVHGKQSGPVLFLSSAIHGDELNGIEIIRQVLATKAVSRLKGTLIAVPVVNAYGLIQASRYLPDRRDLNRVFPGSETGSLAGRIAYVFMQEIVSVSTHGIDLHTGSGHRTNLPQIRADLDDPETERLAREFGVPVMLNASVRDGSLRGSASELGVPILLYEAGEALRYNDMAIRAGVQGILNVMRALGMLPDNRGSSRKTNEPFVARSSSWLRAPESGMFRSTVKLGAQVGKDDIVGYIAEPSTGVRHPIHSRNAGVIIGLQELPLVHEGDAILHLARFRGDIDEVANQVESFQQDHIDDA